MIRDESDIKRLIEEDEWMMEILKAAATLRLPDWWIAAGFVRSKIWDVMHGFQKRTPLPDIDVIYFDRKNTDEAVEKRLEEKLRGILSGVPWSVKNEARMHLASGVPPYTSSVDAISKFPESATAFGVKLDEDGRVMLAAPHGFEDAIHLSVRATPFFTEDEKRAVFYEERLKKKNWKAIWPLLKIHHLRS